MKYVYDKQLRGRTSRKAVVRLVFSSIFVFITLLIIMGVASAGGFEGESGAAAAGLSIFCLGSFLFWMFFSIRSIKKSAARIPQRNPNQYVAVDKENPSYTVTCPICDTKFDYQKKDVGYSAWFRNGYVYCPCCYKPVAHDAGKNAFYNPGMKVSGHHHAETEVEHHCTETESVRHHHHTEADAVRHHAEVKSEHRHHHHHGNVQQEHRHHHNSSHHHHAEKQKEQHCEHRVQPAKQRHPEAQARPADKHYGSKYKYQYKSR